MRLYKTSKKIYVYGIIAAIIGVVIAGMSKGWIIIQLPSRHNPLQTHAQEEVCSLWIYAQQDWHQEKRACVMPKDISGALHALTHAWVAFVNEEKLLPRAIHCDATLVSDGDCAYISFAQTPFDKEQSTYERWMFVESIVRTIRENLPAITRVTLLVKNKPLNDRCLDFSRPWPTQGFVH